MDDLSRKFQNFYASSATTAKVKTTGSKNESSTSQPGANDIKPAAKQPVVESSSTKISNEAEVGNKENEKVIDLIEGSDDDVIDGDVGGDHHEDIEDENEEEFEICGGEVSRFDTIIGVLEEIVMEEGFVNLQEQFFEDNCVHFEDDEENRLIYTDIFNRYTENLEKYLENRLAQEVQNFSMEEFGQLLSENQDQIDEQILEMLLSFSEFTAFKELITDYKKNNFSGAVENDLQIDSKKEMIEISGSPVKSQVHNMKIEGVVSKIHTDEQAEGLEMPELDNALTITSIKQTTRKQPDPK